MVKGGLPFLGWLMLLTLSVQGQRAGVDVMGSPIPGITAHGHHAIGINPSLLATERPFVGRPDRATRKDSLDRRARRAMGRSERMRFVSGFEGTVQVQTPFLDGTSLVRMAQGDAPRTLEDRRVLAQQLGGEKTAVDAQLRWVGWSRHGRLGGWGWTIEDRYMASANPSALLADYVMLGPASSVFDQVLLQDGTIVDSDSLTEAQFAIAESGIRNDAGLLAFELLEGSRFAVQHVRSYGVGMGIQLLDSRALVIGAGLAARYYRGTGYYEVDTENQTAFAAFNRGFGNELLSPDATLGSALRPAGFGVALDVAVRAHVADLWFASLAITEVGSMDWQGESYGLNDPVASLTSWSQGGGGALDLLNDGLAPASLFLEATPERRVVSMPTRARLNGGLYLGQRTLVGIELAAPLNQALLRQPAEVGVGVRSQLGPILGMGGVRWQEQGVVRWPVALVWSRNKQSVQIGLATDDLFGFLAPERRWGWGWSLTRTLFPARGLEEGK